MQSHRRRLLTALALSAATLVVSGSVAAVVLANKRSARARSRAAAAPPRTLSITCRSPALGGTLPAQVYLARVGGAGVRIVVGRGCLGLDLHPLGVGLGDHVGLLGLGLGGVPPV